MRRLVLVGSVALSPATAAAAPTEPNTLQNPLDGAGSCEGCHSFANNFEHIDDAPYSPFMWQGSLMANAARDPVFWAGVALASQDDPTHTEDCIRCHSPNAFLEGRGDAIAITELTGNDFDGVSCDSCHRQYDDGMTPAGNALYVIDDVLVDGAVPKRGPWTYPGPMVPPHSTAQGTLQGDSRLCGTCHDVTTARERVDDQGVGMGMDFNEQRTYAEWLGSAYAVEGEDFRSCQDCHMPAVSDVPGCGNFKGGGEHATGGRRHDLVGANIFVTQILKDIYGDFGTVEVGDFYYDESVKRMDELLATSASLEVAVPVEVNAANGFMMDVTVTNETGHKLPTGYSEGRVAWLEVTATYGADVLWQSGAWEAGTGPVAGDPQLRTYEAIAEDYDDKVTNHLLKNNHWVTDTRIPPRGLMPDPQTDPVTDRYPAQMDGSYAHFDEVNYAFAGLDVTDATPADANDDELVVTVTLRYLINTNAYIDTLAADNMTNSAGMDVKTLFDDRGGATPVTLATYETTIPLTGLNAGGSTGTGSSSSSGGASDTAAESSSSSSSGSVSSTDTDAGSDTNPGTTDGSGGGCSCRGGESGPPWAALAIPVVVMVRRRRDRA